MSSLHLFGINRCILSRNYKTCIKRKPFQPFVSAMLNQVNDPSVKVLFAPKASGKSVASVHSCLHLRSRGHSSLMIDCDTFEEDLWKEMRNVWKKVVPGHSPKDITAFNTVFNQRKPALVVFDQADSLFEKYCEADVKLLLLGLAYKLSLNKTFTVQVNLDSFDLYNKTLDKKILPLFW